MKKLIDNGIHYLIDSDTGSDNVSDIEIDDITEPKKLHNWKDPFYDEHHEEFVCEDCYSSKVLIEKQNNLLHEYNDLYKKDILIFAKFKEKQEELIIV